MQMTIKLSAVQPNAPVEAARFSQAGSGGALMGYIYACFIAVGRALTAPAYETHSRHSVSSGLDRRVRDPLAKR